MGDTPKEKPFKMKNLIHFPKSGKERRILLEDNRDPRIRFATRLRFICGWMLAVGAFCFVLTHYGLFAPSAIQRTAQYALATSQTSGSKTTCLRTVRCSSPVSLTRTVTRCTLRVRAA